MTEPTDPELIADLLAWSQGAPFTDRGELPLWRWQRWMKEAPERAWLVLEGVVDSAPDDTEMMETAATQLELLLWAEPVKSWTRALGLLPCSPLLASILGPEIFTPGHYGPRYRTMEELVSVHLRHDKHFADAHRLVELIRKDPERGLTLALEAISRGPFYGFDAWEVHSPLLDSLRFHGPSVIDSVEKAAKESLGVRRVIYSSRRLNPYPGEPYSIAADVWSRFQAAGAGTTTYNTSMPSGHRAPMDADAEVMLSSWFESESTSWATWKISALARHDPEEAWKAILTITRLTSDPHALCNCGCGPLEDLIRTFPVEVIDRVEAEARSSPAFVEALGCSWLALKDVPEDLAKRYYLASGRNLAVLDAPEGWTESV